VEVAGTGAGGASKEAERRGRGAAKLDVRITLVRRVEPVVPRLEVWSATPKGSRVDELVDGLCQVGVAGWFALETARGVVDPRGTKLERLRKIAAEAGKQCGRAWRMEVEGPLGLGRALAPAAGAAIVVADAAGEPFVATGARLVRLLIGPEGGWSPGELERARGAGARINRFGPHTMRIETAAVAAAAVVMAVEGR
jgi:16S rRNA (uracil1498-N3)-methyltransferase